MPLVWIKHFNALIDNKPFFDQIVTNKQEINWEVVDMSRSNDYLYCQKYCKTNGIDLSQQIIFFNWNSLHARPNSQYEVQSFKKKKHS